MPASVDFGRQFWRAAPPLAIELPPLTAGTIDDLTFRLLADNLPTLCWVANGDGYIVWYNRRWHEYCGSTAEAMEGWGWQSVHDPALLPDVLARWTEAIATSEPFEMTFPLKGADGVFRPFLTRVQPVRGADGLVARWFGVNTEILDLVAAEGALTAERDRSRGVLEGMTEGFVLMDPNFRILDINAEGLRMDRRDRDDVVGKTHWEAWPGTEESEQGGLYKKAMTSREAVSAEVHHLWEDGHSAWVEVRAYPHPEGLAIFYRDISARKATEAALHTAALAAAKEAAERTAILGQLAEGVIVTGPDGQIIFVNDAASRLHGVNALNVPPDDYADTYHLLTEDGDPYPPLELPLARAVLQGASTVDARWRIRRPDGTEVRAIGSAKPIQSDNQGQIGAVLTVRDDTDRACAEDALREASHRLEILNRTGAALAAELDLERLVQLVTDAGVELTGAQFGAFFYNTLNDAGESYMLFTLSGAQRDAFEGFGMPRATAVFQPTFQGKGVIRSDDILLDPRYGHSAPHYGLPKGHMPVRSYLAVPVTSRSGAVIGGLFFGHAEPGRFSERHEGLMTGIAAQAAVAMDNAALYQSAQRELTERQRAEEALRLLNETLEQRVADEIAERAKAEDALRQAQKMEAVGQLTGGIAHDFNNLLTVVIGNVDMAARSLTAGENNRASRAINNALKGAERAATLTQRLLAFSRRQPLKPSPANVDKLVAGMSDMLHRLLGETIELETITNPSLWRVEVDPNQLESALLNLAVNARDAMPEGGKLTIETANARLDEEYSAVHAEVVPGSYVVIAVSDTGGGMSKDVLARVFEPFFTTKDVGKGTGLGLSQVYGFVKQSGGHVKLYSEEGQGTTVKLYLPRLMSSAEDVADAPSPLEFGRREDTVLVVEDDDDVRAYTVEILRELKYRVLEAHDGPSALRLLERQLTPVDVLFTDVVMPGMTGRELADEARRHQPSLKVLYTSGYTRNAIVHGGRLDSGVEMIAKPFTYRTLAAKIRDVLDAGRTGRVLVVDQDPVVRQLALETIGVIGYRLDEAATASELLNRVRSAQGRYDAVVVDADMPDKSGQALALELRSLFAHLPILLATGHQQTTLRDQFAEDRCTGVIGKPYDATTLRAAFDALGLSCRAERKEP
jgi:PAS domain S-box-containing protein